MNRVEVISDPTGDKTTISYDAVGRRQLIEYANDTETTYTYDPTGGIKVIKTRQSSSPSTEFVNLEYTLDKAGRVDEVVDETSARTTYTFDKDYRLAREHRENSSIATFDITYAYDAAGNRTLKVEDGARTTYTYDGRNALTKLEDSGTTTYQYDNRGNRALKIDTAGTTTYSYDVESQLTRIDSPTAVPLATYGYDVFGERLHWEKSSTLITETWDHASLLSRDEGGTRTRFVVTPSELIGQALSQDRAGTKEELVFNSIGTDHCVIDSMPSVSGRIVLSAFGAYKGKDGSVNTVLRFVGEAQYLTDLVGESADSEELLFIRSRYYDPRIGRFLQLDPIGIWGDPLAFGNGYMYAGGGIR